MTNYICVLFLMLAACSRPADPAKNYSKPEIGMLNTDFDVLCKPTTQTADVVSMGDGPSGKRTTLKLVSTSERESTNCSGTFTFVNARLESIQKP